MTRNVALSAILATLLVLGGCATPASITKASINANAELLKPASKEVAEDKDECEATTTTPGWFLKLIGWNSKVKTTVSCT